MAGLLSDVLPAVYSASNVMKNKLRGLLDDPLGTLQQALGDANDRARSFNELGARATAESAASIKAGKGFGMGSPANQELLAKIADAYNPMAMTVWHGSPYKFNKFDAGKIGTGEGAQAYGHGLYLAESPEVARGYQEKLTDPAFRYVAQNQAKARLNEKIAQRVEATDPQRAAALRAQVASLSEPGGALYKVDLPDEHIAKMLDWDKPLSQQHPDVQAAVNGIKDGLPLSAEGWNPKPWIEADPLASTFHNTMHREGLLTQDAMSAALQKQGIPGIRYLDGGSRGTGQGSSNFVVFPGNEGMLTILERNGQPVNALRGLLAQ